MPEETEFAKAADKVKEEYFNLKEQKKALADAKKAIMPFMEEANLKEIHLDECNIKYRASKKGITVATEPNKE